MRASIPFVAIVTTLAVFACGPKEDETKIVSPDGQGSATAALPAVAPAIRATSFDAEIKAIGLDPASLPKFADLTKEQKKALMPLFAKSLGIQCKDCHTGHGETPMMHASMKMWDAWVVGFKVTGEHAGPAFCDSCHQGKRTFLERGDHKAVAGWMKTNFVEHHVSASAPGNGCARCHGEPFQATFVADWKK